LHTLDIDITQVYDDVISSTKRMDLAYDDVLDAMVLAYSAKEHFPANMDMLPTDPVIDTVGCLQNVLIPKRKSYLK
jgi:predicted RNase H-like nuclease